MQSGAGFIPGQIARQLAGRSFNNFRDFRRQFWKLVAKDPDLNQQFSLLNQLFMKAGLAPFAPSQFSTGRGMANRKFNLDHIDALEEQHSPWQALQLLYDLDNLQVLAPFWNQRR